MFEILTVCTGNICRSPLAEQLLRTRLAEFSPIVVSAGTFGLDSAPMTPESVQLAVSLGVAAEDAVAHRSRFLTEQMLVSPALILTATRDHRRAVVERAPARMRSTFTIREFARLANTLGADELRDGGADAAMRVRAMGLAVASRRGLLPPPADPAEDDVIDPYGRSWRTYQRSAAQLEPAVDAVVRAIRLALAP